MSFTLNQDSNDELTDFSMMSSIASVNLNKPTDQLLVTDSSAEDVESKNFITMSEYIDIQVYYKKEIGEILTGMKMGNFGAYVKLSGKSRKKGFATNDVLNSYIEYILIYIGQVKNIESMGDESVVLSEEIINGIGELITEDIITIINTYRSENNDKQFRNVRELMTSFRIWYKNNNDKVQSEYADVAKKMALRNTLRELEPIRQSEMYIDRIMVNAKAILDENIAFEINSEKNANILPIRLSP